MLQLQAKAFDICRISKVLVKYGIKASISNQVITLEGEISNELLAELCNGITICKVQNFDGEVFPLTQKEEHYPKSDEIIPSATADENVSTETHSEAGIVQTVIEEYNLRYPIVKRGQVYICDFGEPYGSEQGDKRYAIVVQNNDGNRFSPTTIVCACTTENKTDLPVHYQFVFSNENMIDYNAHRVSSKPNIVMAEQIRTVDKKRLREFLGTMTPEFMEKIQEIIDISLGLQRREEKAYVDKIVYRNVLVDTNTPKESKDLNMIQVQLLSLVDIKELLRIAQLRTSDIIKAKKIISLFGFDMQKNGVQYLLKAILISPKKAYFNLETLCDSVAESEPGAERSEIKRLIVARIKEHFKLKKPPTIDFIRLVNSFLIKGGEEG